MKNEIQFDMEAAIQALREGKDLSGKDGVLTPLIKQLTEAAMKAELDAHLAASDEPNRKNGSTPKKVKAQSGSLSFRCHATAQAASIDLENWGDARGNPLADSSRHAYVIRLDS